MEEIKTHRGSKLNDMIFVEPLGDQDVGGARNQYQLYLKQHGQWERFVAVKFQDRPLIDDKGQETQPNGLTNEALLAIVIDRLQSWQYDKKNDRAGKFACRENALAITHLEEAIMWLQWRSRDRRERNVEGRAEK